MAVFEYKGLNEAGKAVNGLKEADSAKGLRALLRKDGIFLTEVLGEADPSTGKKSGLGAKEIRLQGITAGRVTTEDIAIMTRQLATLLKAGVALVESLSTLVDQIEKERFKRVLSDIKQRVNEGSSLADAMAQHRNVFGALYVNMIRAGESSGALDAVLLRLADFTANQAQLRNKVMSTMMYPFLMTFVGSIVMVVMMTVVVPKVTKMFQDMKATLPWTTRLLIAVSDLLQNYWYILLPSIVASVAALVFYFRSEKGKPVWDKLALSAPIFGTLVRRLAMARFARTLSTLLASGVPLLAAMDIVKNVITNSILAKVVENTREAVREGESIAGPLKRSKEFEPMVYHMVAIGERSGQLEEMLVHVADNYEQQVAMRITSLTALLEPLLIILMGAGIGFIAFSILMPIMQINSALR